MFKWLRRKKGKTKQVGVRFVSADSAQAVITSETIVNVERSQTRPEVYIEPSAPVSFDSQTNELVLQPASEEKPLVTNSFALVRPVLDTLYSQITDSDNELAQVTIRVALQDLKDGYETEAKRVSYSSIQTQFAYLYRYAPGRASIICQIMESSQTLKALIRRQSLNIACFGGGPGTDVLGVLKLKGRLNGAAIINATVYDREHGWETIWRLIETEARTREHASVGYRFGDMLDPAWQIHESWDTDLAIMSYSLSELSGQALAAPFLSNVIAMAKSGTLFLIVDNGDGRAEATGELPSEYSPVANHEAIDTTIRQWGLKTLGRTHYKLMEVERSEWHSALSNYDKYALANPETGDRGYPQRRYKLAYWVLQKP